VFVSSHHGFVSFFFLFFFKVEAAPAVIPAKAEKKGNSFVHHGLLCYVVLLFVWPFLAGLVWYDLFIV
jgi:hypothetical protein